MPQDSFISMFDGKLMCLLTLSEEGDCRLFIITCIKLPERALLIAGDVLRLCPRKKNTQEQFTVIIVSLF